MDKKPRMSKEYPDEIDVTILLELKRYPPSTMRTIGQKINRSHVTVRERMLWLEERGFIQHLEGVPRSSPRSKILTEKGMLYLGNKDEILQNAK